MSTEMTVGALAMTSKEIAELTGRTHSNVMRDIRAMLERLEAASDLNWHCESTTYIDEQGKNRDMYQLDKATTMCLVTGYDPIPRMRIIKRWQELEAKVAPKTTGDLLVQMALAYQEHERRMLELESRQTETEDRLAHIETASDHFTVLGWCRSAGKNSVPLKSAAVMGRRATSFCNERGVAMGKVPDPRFGTANTYPKWVLEALFNDGE